MENRRRQGMLMQRLQRQQPLRRLREQSQRLDGLALRLQRPLPQRLQLQRQRLQHLTRRLSSVGVNCLRQRHEVRLLVQRLRRSGPLLLQQLRERVGRLGHQLHTVSPLNTLGRGYAIAQKMPEGEIVRRADQVKVGDALRLRLSQGELHCRVSEK